MRIEVEFVYPTPFCGGMSSWFSEPVGNLPFRLPHSVEISGNASHTQLLCGSAKRVGRIFPIKTGSPPLRSRDRCKITVGNVLAERRPRNRVTGGRVVKRVAGDWAKLPGPDEGEARGHIAIRLAPRDKIKQLSASLSQRESLRFHQRIKGKSTEESTSLSAIPPSLPHSKSMKIIRVFPRRTNATPTDDLSYTTEPSLFAEADEVHVSVTFTWDLPEAERLAKEWKYVAPVKFGGPATGQRGEQFEPGTYIKKGYVITSRGCPNRCWFCSVPKREGDIRELEIKDGWNVFDDNLLACSEQHIRSVFSMLARQKERVHFTGGLEAARLKPWIAEELRKLKPKQIFFAYDTPDDLEPLREAGRMMLKAGFTITSHALRCFVLCGYPKDTVPQAEVRMDEALQAGFLPMAMLWRDKDGKRDPVWARWQRRWARPAITSQFKPLSRREFPSKTFPISPSFPL